MTLTHFQCQVSTLSPARLQTHTHTYEVSPEALQETDLTKSQRQQNSQDDLPLSCDLWQRQGFPWPASYPEQGEIEKSLLRLESYLPPKTLSPLPQQQRADYWTVPFCC